MRDSDDACAGLGLIILAILIIFIATAVETYLDKKKWNDGHCECGGNWEYIQAVGHRYSTYYMYECDTCGQIHEFVVKR